jgi:uncharacterized protein
MLRQRWDAISFLHWRTDPAAVRTRIPGDLEIDTFDGSAWIGLVPFITTMRPPVLDVPASVYPETNVRTYVREPDGTPGIWFFSLDVPRWWVVASARLAFGLGYAWSRMDVRQEAAEIGYSAERRLPGRARSEVVVAPGPRIPRTKHRPIDDFLTARFRLYASTPIGLARVDVHHPPWSLRRGTCRHVDDELITAAGLPAPSGPPLVHLADPVDVTIDPPAKVRSAAPFAA